MTLEMEHLLEPELVKRTIEEGADTVMNKFYRRELGIILENIGIDGSLSNSFEGRLVNPGHGLESMWFLMGIGVIDDEQLIRKAVDISLQLLEYGGIFYFLDVKGNPPQQLEWDQKLWGCIWKLSLVC